MSGAFRIADMSMQVHTSNLRVHIASPALSLACKRRVLVQVCTFDNRGVGLSKFISTSPVLHTRDPLNKRKVRKKRSNDRMIYTFNHIQL